MTSNRDGTLSLPNDEWDRRFPYSVEAIRRRLQASRARENAHKAAKLHQSNSSRNPSSSCGPETQQGADSSCFSQYNDHYGGSNRTSDPKHCHPPLPDHRREQNEKGSVVPPQGQECQTSIRRLSDNESENEWGCNLPNAEPPIPSSASQDLANLQHNIDRRRHCGTDGEDSGPIENGATEQARDDAVTQLPRKRRRMSPSTPTTHETASRPQTRLHCAGLQPPRAQPSKHRRSQRGLFIPPSSGTSTSKDETKAPVAKVEEWPLDGAVLRRVIVKGVTTFQLQFQWDAPANREQKQRTPGIPRRKSAAERTSSTARIHPSRVVPMAVVQDNYFEVEDILDSRQRGKQIEYLVRWEGYGHEHDSWEPARHFNRCPEILQEFHQRKGLSAPGQ
jgi:hypothetical protein